MAACQKPHEKVEGFFDTKPLKQDMSKNRGQVFAPNSCTFVFATGRCYVYLRLVASSYAYLTKADNDLAKLHHRKKMARLEGIEPPTKGLENPCSIQLSYRRGLA